MIQKGSNMRDKLFGLIALALLALFFFPIAFKLKQIDLSLLLLAGIAMPLYDLLVHRKNSK